MDKCVPKGDFGTYESGIFTYVINGCEMCFGEALREVEDAGFTLREARAYLLALDTYKFDYRTLKWVKAS